MSQLDRDIRKHEDAYDVFVTNSDEYNAEVRQWYRDSHEGREPALSDCHHIFWRTMTERDWWITPRKALQDAWPLPQAPITPGEAVRLRAQGEYFIKENGERFTAICATDFNLQKLMCDGGDPRPVLAQRAAAGFNMVRTFIVGDWNDPAYLCRPQDHPDYYDKLGQLADLIKSYGMYFQACAFCDTPRIFPTQESQLDHWTRTVNVLYDKTNVLLELVNENNVPINTLNPDIFARPNGMLASHGSNGSQSLAVRPWWDWEAFHTNGAPEEQRKIGHNAMELSEGTPDWPASHVPTITNETSRYPEVGMWRNSSLDRQKTLAFDSAAGAALLNAGSCFHSVNGKLSRLWDGNEEAVARAWADGARSVPLEYQDGRYTASHLVGIQLEPNELRRYGRVLSDGRTHWVSIKK